MFYLLLLSLARNIMYSSGHVITPRVYWRAQIHHLGHVHTHQQGFPSSNTRRNITGSQKVINRPGFLNLSQKRDWLKSQFEDYKLVKVVLIQVLSLGVVFSHLNFFCFDFALLVLCIFHHGLSSMDCSALSQGLKKLSIGPDSQIYLRKGTD